MIGPRALILSDTYVPSMTEKNPAIFYTMSVSVTYSRSEIAARSSGSVLCVLALRPDAAISHARMKSTDLRVVL